MSACCDEPECRRTSPIRFYKADFTGTVYAVTRSRLVRERGGGRATLRAVERHYVTEQLRAFVRENREWVLEALNREES